MNECTIIPAIRQPAVRRNACTDNRIVKSADVLLTTFPIVVRGSRDLLARHNHPSPELRVRLSVDRTDIMLPARCGSLAWPE